MPLYVVTYNHPDAQGWAEHVAAHVGYLQDLLAEGVLLASGPFAGGPDKAALLILRAPDRGGLEALVARDPFAEHGLIFGAFNEASSLPGRLQTR